MTEILNIKKFLKSQNKKHLRISSDPPFCSVSICDIKLRVILSQSIAKISDKNEWLLIIILPKGWFACTVCGVVATW